MSSKKLPGVNWYLPLNVVLSLILVLIFFPGIVYALTTGLLSPTTTGSVYAEWTNGDNIFTSDGNDATESVLTERLSVSDFGFVLPTGATIDTILFQVEGARRGPGCSTTSVDVAISWDGGTSWGTDKRITYSSTTDSIESVGGDPLTYWGHAFTYDETTDTNFMMRLTYAARTGAGGGSTCNLDVDHTRGQIDYTAEAIYSLNITSPLTTSVLQSKANKKETAQFNFTADEVQLTQNITIENITVGGVHSPISTVDICEGTASACSFYTGDSLCTAAGCGFNTVDESTMQIRTGTNTTVDVNPKVINFTNQLNTSDYGIFISPSSEVNFVQSWGATWGTNPVTNSSFDAYTVTTTGTAAATNVSWLILPHGEYNDDLLGLNIKCGNITNAVGSAGNWTVSFDTPYTSNEYVTLCSPILDDDSAECGIESSNTTGFTIINGDDGGLEETILDFSWCTFTQLANYTISGQLFRSGNFTSTGTDQQITMEGTNFSDTNYVVMATQRNAPGFSDICSCETTPSSVSQFNVSCVEDNNAACVSTINYLATEIATTNINPQTQLCQGTQNACSFYGSDVSCVSDGCLWNNSQELWNVAGDWFINFTTPDLAVGLYDLFINATYNSGATNRSRFDNQSLSVNISANAAPTVTLTGPGDDSSYKYTRAFPLLEFEITDVEGDLYTAKLFAPLKSDTNNKENSLIYKSEGNAAFLSVGTNLQNIPVSNNSESLKALWHFDNETGDGEGSSKNYINASNNASWGGTLEKSIVKFGYSIDVNGSQFINSTYTPNYASASDFSVSFWFYPRDTTTLQKMIGVRNAAGGHVEIGMTDTTCDSSQVSIRVKDDAGIIFQTLCSDNMFANDNAWNHMIAIRDSTSGVFRVTLNGVEINESIGSEADGSIDFTGKPFYMGARNNNDVVASYFDGYIDEVAFFDKALNFTERQDLYYIGIGDYDWYVNATDTLGNTEQQKSNFTILALDPTGIDLNSPVNDSNYFVDIFNITLDWTTSGDDPREVIVYGSDDATVFNPNGIIDKRTELTGTIQDTLNWTSIPNKPNASTQLLWHLDKLSEFSESDTFVNDFSTVGENDGVLTLPTVSLNQTYFADDSSSNPWYPNLIHPISQELNNMTYIVYGGDNHDPYINRYNITSTIWDEPVIIADNPIYGEGQGFDDHGRPSMIIDNESYIHVWFGAHNSEQQYYKSTNPENITSWVNMTANISGSMVNPLTSGGKTGTYPQAIYNSDTGLLTLWYRVGASPQGDWYVLNSTDNGNTWGTQQQILEGGVLPFYASIWDSHNGTRFHVGGIVSLDTTDANNRINLYYLWMNASTGNWYSVNGTLLTLPIDSDNTDVLVHTETRSYLPHISVDELGNPHMFSVSGITANSLFQRHNGWNGTAWSDDEITEGYFRAARGKLVVHNSTYIDAYTTGKNSTEAQESGQFGVENWKTYDGGTTWTLNQSVLNPGSRVKLVKDRLNGPLFSSWYAVSGHQVANDPHTTKLYLWDNTTGFAKRPFDVSAGQFQQAKLGWGLNADSNTYTINAGNNHSLAFNTSGKYTWSAWIDLESQGTIFQKYSNGVSGYRLRVNTANKTEFWNESAVVLTGTSAFDFTSGFGADGFHHLAATYDGGTITLYNDGLADGSTSSGFNNDTTNSFIVGESSNSSLGTIDEIVFMNDSLSATAIKDMYRMKINTYFWQVAASSDTDSNQSEIRTLNVLASFNVYSITLSELFDINTVMDRFLNLFRPIFELFDINILMSRIFEGFRSVIESFRIDIAFQRIASLVRELIELISINSLVDRFNVLIRNPIQEITIDTILESVAVKIRNVFGILHITDQSERTIALFRNLLELFDIQSTITRAQLTIIKIVESFKVNSLVERSGLLLREFIDSIQIDSLIDRFYSGERSIDQEIIIDGTTERTGIFSRAISIPFIISDSVVGIFTNIANIFSRSVSEVFQIDTTLERFFRPVRGVLNSLRITSILNRTTSMFRSVVQFLNMETLLSRLRLSTGNVDESLDIESLNDRVFLGDRSIDQEIIIDGTTERTGIFSRLLSIPFIISDSVKGIFTDIVNLFSRTIGQIFNIESFMDRFFVGERSIDQEIIIDGTTERTGIFGRLLSIPFIIVDSVKGVFQDIANIFSRSITETFNVDSTSSRFFGPIRKIIESLKIEPLINRTVSLFRSVLEFFNIDIITSRLKESFANLNEFLNIDSLIDRFYSGDRSIDQEIIIDGTTERTGIFSRLLSIPFIISDSVKGVFQDIANIFSRTVGQIFNIESFMDRFFLGERSIDQEIIIDGTTERTGIFGRFLSIPFIISDSISVVFTEVANVFSRTSSQEFTITVAIERTFSPIRNIIEQLQIDIIVDRYTELFRVVSNPFEINSEVAKLREVTVDSPEYFIVADTVSSIKTFVVKLIESFKISSLLDRFVEFFREIIEQIEIILQVSAPGVAVPGSAVDQILPNTGEVPYLELNRSISFGNVPHIELNKSLVFENG